MALSLIFIIVFAPIASFLVIAALPKSLKKHASALSIGAVLSSFLACVYFLFKVPEIHSKGIEFQWSWMESGTLSLTVGFLIDRLNLLMLLIVTSVSFFVQVFSIGYMAEEGRGKSRYFAFLSLFTFAMINLVASNNLLQTFIFWELVGLASYLLIGFWYQKPSAALASRKAFVVTRLGDFGFYLAVALLIIHTGNLNFSFINSPEISSVLSAGIITLIVLLIFLGIMGKSAQFPLHIWLPDAMEGPTPVSALIHSATMVAAGVFLMARCFAFFSLSHTAMSVILIFGALTALVGATLAMIQNDIKRVLAYSTVSQLGLMMMALGAGSYVSGVFHLTTHAFFKSLLFLSAGSLIHHFHSNDLWDMAKHGSKFQKLTLSVLIVGGLSLAGIFPFAGFWSKDMILEALHHHAIFFYVVLAVSFCTSYYVFRMLFILTLRSSDHHKAHHGSSYLDRCMNFPIVSLAVISVIAGLMGTGLLNHQIIHFIDPKFHAEFSISLAAQGTIAALLAMALTYWIYGIKKSMDPQRSGFVRKLLENRFYMDHLFEGVLGRWVLTLSRFLNWFDKQMINGKMVNGTGRSTLRLGALISRLQTGELQDYLMILFVVGSVLIYLLAR